MGYIVDLSHHQQSAKINYSVFCKQLDLAIIRIQYGTSTIDRGYKNHINKMKQYQVPFGVYAWVRGKNEAEMRKEARSFYEHAKEFEPLFYALDVEEKLMDNIRQGIEWYVDELKSLTSKPIALYVANHLYKSFNLNVQKFDFVWIPKYSNSQPVFPCQLWQYTSKGKLNGYDGVLDLNKLVNGATMDIFNIDITEQDNAKNEFRTLKLTNPMMKGTDVKFVQMFLFEHGFFTGQKIDGIFGQATKNAVIKFQKEKGLTIDGIVGRNTWSYINN